MTCMRPDDWQVSHMISSVTSSFKIPASPWIPFITPSWQNAPTLLWRAWRQRSLSVEILSIGFCRWSHWSHSLISERWWWRSVWLHQVTERLHQVSLTPSSHRAPPSGQFDSIRSVSVSIRSQSASIRLSDLWEFWVMVIGQCDDHVTKYKPNKLLPVC